MIRCFNEIWSFGGIKFSFVYVMLSVLISIVYYLGKLVTLVLLLCIVYEPWQLDNCNIFASSYLRDDNNLIILDGCDESKRY